MIELSIGDRDIITNLIDVHLLEHVWLMILSEVLHLLEMVLGWI